MRDHQFGKLERIQSLHDGGWTVFVAEEHRGRMRSVEATGFSSEAEADRFADDLAVYRLAIGARK